MLHCYISLYNGVQQNCVICVLPIKVLPETLFFLNLEGDGQCLNQKIWLWFSINFKMEIKLFVMLFKPKRHLATVVGFVKPHKT